MKKILLSLMLMISVLTFAKVEITNTKYDDGKGLTGGRTVTYKDKNVTFSMDYEKYNCVAIKVKTSKNASDVDPAGFMIDGGMNYNLNFKVAKNGKEIIIKPQPDFYTVVTKIEIGKGQIWLDYTSKNNQTVAITIPITEIKKAIEEVKSKAEEPINRITNKTRMKDGKKQVYIDGTGWVYESLIEK